MPPGRKPPAQTYLPPHLRRSGTAGAASQAPRSLEEVAADRLQILVRYSDGGPFSMEGCPDPVVEGTAGPQAPAPAGTCQVMLNTPPCPDDYDRQQLLTWFTAASSANGGPEYPNGDYRASLVFPATMTKAERAAWHHAAERYKLNSQSQGIGAERHLVISARAEGAATQRPVTDPGGTAAAGAAEQGVDLQDAAGDGDAAAQTVQHSSTSGRHRRSQAAQSSSSSGGRGPEAASRRKPQPRWKRVWLWCQMEGQFEHSQGEVQELLASGDPLPPALQEVIDRREALERLMAALASGDTAGAQALVQQHPKLAWTRHDVTEDYPAHVAAARGQAEVLAALLAAGSNVLEQKNRQRDTPVMVAAACGTLQALEPVFEQQGDSYQRQLARLGRNRSQGARTAAAAAEAEGAGKAGAGWHGSRQQSSQPGTGADAPGGAGANTAEGDGSCSWLERRKAFKAAQQQQHQDSHNG